MVSGGGPGRVPVRAPRRRDHPPDRKPSGRPGRTGSDPRADGWPGLSGSVIEVPDPTDVALPIDVDRTVPSSPSTVTWSPVRIAAVDVLVPTTHGIPNSRADGGQMGRHPTVVGDDGGDVVQARDPFGTWCRHDEHLAMAEQAHLADLREDARRPRATPGLAGAPAVRRAPGWTGGDVGSSTTASDRACSRYSAPHAS